MHMARLQDTSRLRGEGLGYSLEALTGELLGIRKRPMKEIFGVPRLRKDGTPGSKFISLFASCTRILKIKAHLCSLTFIE